jgi:cyclic pyranopterin phosphate synthase
MSLTGVILAGGRGTRMGGRDKGLVSCGGRPMIESVLRRLSPQVDATLIVANRNLAAYRRYGVPVVADDPPANAGPLGGIATGLRAADTDAILIVPCDCPNMARDLAAQLDRARNDKALAAACIDGRLQPLFALIDTALLPELRRFLDAGDRAVHRWYEQQAVAQVDFSDCAAAFGNVNTPGDLHINAPRLLEARSAASSPGPVPREGIGIEQGSVEDRLHRPLRDLRISVTDRCNFRCVYCMPRAAFAGHAFLPRSELLSFEEITHVARAAAALGVHKIRLTGGEPLLRRDLDRLIAMLAGIDGIDDLALTTNGSLLAKRARELKAAGLRRVTVSLDALDPKAFRQLSDTPDAIERVLAGIDAAAAAGLAPIKINMVVKRGVNEDQILTIARRFRHTAHVPRFIEYMDVGNSNGWRNDDVVAADAIRGTIDAAWPLEPIEPRYSGEVARRWRYRDGGGEIGLIASVTQPFCGGCTRARLSAEGKLYTCLFAGNGFDVRDVLREGIGDANLRRRLAGVWMRREDRYSERRAHQGGTRDKIEMSYIGG